MNPTGATLIAIERTRQVDEEGWTPEHDAAHDRGELLRAAECYLQAAMLAKRAPEALESVRRYLERAGEDPDEDRFVQQIIENYPRQFFGWDKAPSNWPWHRKWWKPSNDPIRCLEKAGALIAAEIDRLSV